MAWHSGGCRAVVVFGGQVLKVIILRILTSALLLAIGWTDYRTMKIPDILSLGLGLCAAAAVFVCPEVPLLERCVGACIVSVPMYLFCLVAGDAFGEGDMLLLAVMGFYLGWKSLLVGTFLGFMIGGIQAVYLLKTGKAKRGEHAHMPFGPALCAGLLTAQFYGMEIFMWYRGFFY